MKTGALAFLDKLFLILAAANFDFAPVSLTSYLP
ncbi:MAG: hypothetical protein AVDCRST_MAG74-1161 [uncultured Pyrinomonadaceae bacterium]|uniref:Uncharacterized protein n=1 Tax=uncultured Pyrinomonadaceae bacterium TaxID=2283094 RepID=A0A6J4NPH4_9BACT|nr:MAG: hypothetical protein AVDCRST_MAG74-1161 [uncultured Pyrinomonadaceae bacterium]